MHAHLAAVREDFLRPPAASVTYADAASIATGKTGGTGADKFGGDNKSTRSEAESDDEENGVRGSDEDDDDDADASANRLRHFSAVDMRRLWALDSLVGALRNPAVPVLRQKAAVLQFVSFLALHAFADVSIPSSVLEAADSEEAVARAPASTFKSGSKRQRAPSIAAVVNPEVSALRTLVHAVGASDMPAESHSDAARGSATSSTGTLRACASFLVADPPISAPLREELRARLLTLLHELPKQQLGSSGAGGRPVGGKAKSVEAQQLPPLAPPQSAWDSCHDRAGSMLQMQVDLATRVQEVWAAVAVCADRNSSAADDEERPPALVATAFPAAAELAVVGDDSEEIEGDDSDSSSSGSKSASSESDNATVDPAALRVAALEASKLLRTAASAALQRGGGGVDTGGSSRHRVAEASRQLLAYSALLSHGALQVLLSPGDDAIASAVADVLGCAAVLQADAIATVKRALLAAAEGGAGAAPPTPAGKKKSAAPKSAGPTDTAFAAAAASLDALTDLASPYVGGAGELMVPSSELKHAATGPGPQEALLVLVDAALALLSGAGATVREVVKAALRPHFVHATAAVVEAILSIVSASRSSTEEGEIDGEGGGAESGSDAESITLGPGTLLAPFTAALGAGSTASAKADEASDEDETERDGRSGAAEMERYDSMLANMLRMRKHARTAASHNRRRALHFKFRALSLLDAAVSGLGHAEGSADRGVGRSGNAQLALLLFPVPLLRTARVLAARARGQTADADNTAGDSAALLTRVLALLSRVSKQRVPALALLPSSAPAADAVGGFAEVLELAQRAPSPEVSRAAEGVASMILRALRAGSSASSSVSAGVTPGGGGGTAASQVSPAYVGPVVSAYAELLERHFAGKRSNVGASFLRAAVSGMPVIAVRLLPVLARIIADGRVAKVFRLHEAVQLLTVMVRSASGPGSRDLLCDVAQVASAPPSARKKKHKAADPTPASASPITVSACLAAAIPIVMSAAAAVIAGTAKGSASSGGDSLPATTLPVKHAKDAVALVSMLFKLKLGPEGVADVEAASDTLFRALAELVRAHGSKHGVLQQVSRCYELAGREAPAFDAAGGGDEEGVVVPIDIGLDTADVVGATDDGIAAVGDVNGEGRAGKKKQRKS